MNARVALAVVSVLAAVGSASADILYGISNGFGVATDNTIYQINPATGASSGAVQVTLAGFTVTNSLALTAHPTTGSLWGVIQTSGGSGNRKLVTIDPVTGVATNIGALTNQISSIAFKADGTLIGVSGDGGTPAETLFQISTINAGLTTLFALGNGADGEVIAMHPSGLLYHSSGNATALFESVNLTSQVVTPLGSASGEAFGMGWSSALGQMFLCDIGNSLFTVNLTNGSRTLIGGIGSAADTRGIAVVIPAPGFAPLMGLAGLVALRRRRS